MTGVCPVCARVFSIENGVIHTHYSRRFGSACIGSGRPPFCKQTAAWSFTATEPKQEKP